MGTLLFAFISLHIDVAGRLLAFVLQELIKLDFWLALLLWLLSLKQLPDVQCSNQLLYSWHYAFGDVQRAWTAECKTHMISPKSGVSSMSDLGASNYLIVFSLWNPKRQKRIFDLRWRLFCSVSWDELIDYMQIKLAGWWWYIMNHRCTDAM